MTRNLVSLFAALCALTLSACGGLEDDQATGTPAAQSTAALTPSTQVCHGPYRDGNPKMCYFSVAEKEAAAHATCVTASNYYGITLVVTNEDDHLPCVTTFDCCTP